MKSSAPILLTLLALTNACGAADVGDDEGRESLGHARQAIVHGEPSDETDDAVVYVEARSSASHGTSCTGTLIAPNLVATALHCIAFSSEGTFKCNPDGSLDPNSPGDGAIGQLLPAASVEIHSGRLIGSEPAAVGARLIGTGSNQICRNDLAFVVLDRELDLPIAPVRLSSEVRRGERVRIVGYGQTEEDGSEGRYRRSNRRVVDVGPSSDSEPLGTAAPRTFVIDEGPCHGDSGGPALSEETGALLGVYSLAAGATCTAVGVRNVFTRLGAFETLALDAFAAAGHEPLLEPNDGPPPPPVGATPSGCALAAPAGGAPTGAFALLALALAGLAARKKRR